MDLVAGEPDSRLLLLTADKSKPHAALQSVEVAMEKEFAGIKVALQFRVDPVEGVHRKASGDTLRVVVDRFNYLVVLTEVKSN